MILERYNLDNQLWNFVKLSLSYMNNWDFFSTYAEHIFDRILNFK